MASKEKDLEKENKKKEGKSKKNIWLTAGSIFILVLSAVAFILVPSLGGFTSGQETKVVGSYNGKKIEYGYGTDYLTAVQNYAQYYQQQAQAQGKSISQMDYYYIFQGAFNTVVLNMMYTDLVNDSGYVPAENAIKREMIQYFTDENGNYSAKAFREASETYKKSLRESIVKSNISNRFSLDSLGQSTKYIKNTLYGLKTPANESSFFADLTRKTRSFEMVSFAKADYPDDKTLEYANKNVDLFKQYSFSAITASEESELKKIKSQLDNNEVTFDDAASTLSSKSYCDDNGKVTSKFAYQFKNILTSDEDFAKITSLSAGSVSDITKTGTGYIIFRCDAAPVAANLSDSDTLKTIKDYIRYNEEGLVDDYFMGLAEDFASSAATLGFDDAAIAAGVEKKEIPEFAINYGGNSYLGMLPFSGITELSGAETNETFFRTAFALKPNEISSPITIGNNIIVLKLLNETVNEEPAESDIEYYEYFVSAYLNEGFDQVMLANGDIQNDVFSLWAEMAF